ncbi:hypothetical protein H3143_00005 [Mycoplasma tullyi]|uniref:Uncharacterized protein n=1 Tax=Mycoplasma tullyi TaxID=1612150 RepID=A0A7D7U482_9MOLU|nr:hypothetical protein [Mycoplasma tullyi]QMT98530.1 hypothetical protein H3143_00005 [Mycoplasma tullyi]
MENKKTKKKERRFTDLSADLDDEVDTIDPEYEDSQEIKIEMNKNNQVIDKNDPFFYSESFEEARIQLIKDKKAEIVKEKVEEIPVKNEISQPKKEETVKDVYIDSSLEIASQEPLTKGMHFYTNSRIIRKVRECAKNKGLSISRLITMILDKSIKEE